MKSLCSFFRVVIIVLSMTILAGCESTEMPTMPIAPSYYVTPSDLLNIPTYKYCKPDSREPVRTVGIEIQHSAYSWDMNLKFGSFESVGGSSFSIYVAQGYELTNYNNRYYIKKNEGGGDENYIEISFWEGKITDFLDIAPLIIESNEDVFISYESSPYFVDLDPRYPVRSFFGATLRDEVGFSYKIMETHSGYICVYLEHNDDGDVGPSAGTILLFMAETLKPEE